MDTLLTFSHVVVTLPSTDRFLAAQGERDKVLDDVSFSIPKGRIVGLVGESGSGKSMIALTIPRLLKDGGKIESGSVLWEGRDLTRESEEALCQIRGREISMIFQEPMTSLNPVLTIGQQVAEPLKIHTKLSEKEINQRVMDSLTEVGLSDASSLMKQYPHELSGGMRQRVMIALAMITRPKLLIADEPTTALDVVLQSQILTLLKKISDKYGTSVLFISHDLGVIRRICDEVIVLYQGKVIETGSVKEVFESPKEAYTKTLVAKFPAISTEASQIPLATVSHLTAYYEEKKGLLGKTVREEILHDISFEIYQEEILGVVGESGSGKTSLARVLTGLNSHYSGTIEYSPSSLRPQMIFQDPYGSLNPAHTVGWMMGEALVHDKIPKKERRETVIEMLQEVGLDSSYYDRLPSELSGGQRQRVSIGTALLYGSSFLIADEAVSALDVTVRSQILELLLRLQQERHLTILMITHDIHLVEHFCHRVLVLYQGRIIESGQTKEVLKSPQQEYTKRLIKESI